MYGWESGLESTDLYCNATERENASCYISGGTDSSDATLAGCADSQLPRM